jgi:uncharacterized membrane protein
VGNPAVSTAELGGSVLTAGLAVMIPIVAAILVVVMLFFFIRTIIRWFGRRSERKRLGSSIAPPNPPQID